MKRLILFLGLTLIASVSLFGQPDMKLDDDWMEKIRAEKVAYLTTELKLTPEEAQQFWPVYNEFEKKRFEIHMERRKMEQTTMENVENQSEEQLRNVSSRFIAFFQKEADLMKEYNEKFFKVLPAQKVVKFYDVENDFRSHMLKEYRRKQGYDHK